MDNSLDFSGGYVRLFPETIVIESLLNHVRQMEKKILQVGQSCLWFAGKKWSSDQAISKYLGHNEKTKVIVRLQRISSGAPVREPGVDRETHKKMMAYYHKKQEEQKVASLQLVSLMCNADTACAETRGGQFGLISQIDVVRSSSDEETL